MSSEGIMDIIALCVVVLLTPILIALLLSFIEPN